MNRLAAEKSPYLLQHAHNPVDWFPWGEAAFAKAQAEDKPLLVSIGYSTCHWCHVMERESFEDPAIAEVMNRNLVCVKVDREERPDVDRLYMTAVQALTGQGGWPLNVFLSPDGKPFLGGTYFPPQDRYGRAGWPHVVERIGKAWKDPQQRERLTAQGEGLTRALADLLAGPPAEEPGGAVQAAGACAESLRGAFDEAQGGFAHAPKFPMPVNQYFLFRHWVFKGRPGPGQPGRESLDQALFTLSRMAAGGIFDQVGGGFHRYSTDPRWHVPHFEKMLYDNAQLALNYLDAFRITRDPAHARTARRTLEYLRREMRHPDGGFFSAQDADSLPDAAAKEKKEGAFFVWTQAEIESVLGAEAALFIDAFGVKPDGNVLEDPHGEFPGVNVLYRAADDADLTPRHGPEVPARLDTALARLAAARAARPLPHLDDKVLTAWNGLAISAFASAEGLIPGEWGATATQAADFIRRHLWDEREGKLYRRWRDGDRGIAAMADDHAFLAQGLLDLYEAGFDLPWLLWAERLADILNRDFIEGGAVYTTAAGHDPRVVLRATEEGDNVEPSAASVAAQVFLRLARLRGREDLAAAARAILERQLGHAVAQPRNFPQLIAAALFAEAMPQEVIIAGARGEAWEALRREIRGGFRPFGAALWADQGPAQKTLSEGLPHLKDLRAAQPQVYLCEKGSCRAPESDPTRLAVILGG